jgi:hypothetical protein
MTVCSLFLPPRRCSIRPVAWRRVHFQGRLSRDHTSVREDGAHLLSHLQAQDRNPAVSQPRDLFILPGFQPKTMACGGDQGARGARFQGLGLMQVCSSMWMKLKLLFREDPKLPHPVRPGNHHVGALATRVRSRPGSSHSPKAHFPGAGSHVGRFLGQHTYCVETHGCVTPVTEFYINTPLDP